MRVASCAFKIFTLKSSNFPNFFDSKTLKFAAFPFERVQIGSLRLKYIYLETRSFRVVSTRRCSISRNVLLGLNTEEAKIDSVTLVHI